MSDYEKFMTSDGVLYTSSNDEFYVIADVSTFSINLYKMNCNQIVIDKINYLTLIDTLTGTLRSNCNLIAPVIDIEYDIVPDFNYIYIPSFNRYYFVTDIENTVNRMWKISLKCDVLMSYKDEIKKQTAIISRQEILQDKYFADDKIPFTNEKETIIFNGKTESSFVFNNRTEHPLIIVRTLNGGER